jgi:hypothetical protein
MSHQQAIKLLRSLPPQLQQEVFDFIEFLAQKAKNVQSTTQTEPQKRGGYGSLKGKIWMSDDFDAPLEDFKEATLSSQRPF